MLRLVESSNPGDVDRDTAVRLLAQRAVLTRAVCRELQECSDFAGRRPTTALSLLLQWVWQNFAESVRVEPHASDGLDKMIVPENCQELMQEIRAGAEVAEALFMLTTADTMSQLRGDEEVIRDRLSAYWAKHGTAVVAPSVFSCWTGMSGNRPSG